MTKVLALDQALGTTGLAIGSSSDDIRGGYRFGTISTPKSPELGERLCHLFKELDNVIIANKPLDLLCFEQPFMPVGNIKFNVETISALQRVAGCVQTIAAFHGIPVEEYTSDEWRFTVLGYSKAPFGMDPKKKRAFLKKAVSNKMRSLGYDVTKDDQGDALGLLMHAITGKAASSRMQLDLLSRVSL